jgi:4-hydroxythreonine-4-phosphate dehydrogenase
MSHLKRIAISVGDLNGVGFEIALKAHNQIKILCEPRYCINHTMAQKSASLLNIQIPNDFHLVKVSGEFEISKGSVCRHSGRYSFDSFQTAVDLARTHEVDAVVTLPVHKEAWQQAGLSYVGHTDALRDFFKSEAIMMLGCEKLFVALYTEHIPLKEVPNHIDTKKITNFLLRLHKNINRSPIGVLGLNPHAGDHGVIGDEERFIGEAILQANTIIGSPIFEGPLVPDIAFTPKSREYFKTIVAMYHDQGLAPLKALYFDEGINISLGLPIIRTSVDHGTAFDIAYQNKASTQSYINAIKAAVEMSTGHL